MNTFYTYIEEIILIFLKSFLGKYGKYQLLRIVDHHRLRTFWRSQFSSEIDQVSKLLIGHVSLLCEPQILQKN